MHTVPDERRLASEGERRWNRAVRSSVPFAIAAAFLLLCCAFVPYAGIEGDEAFFSWPIYGSFDRHYGITVFHKHVPLMVFPYAGTLKTLYYLPILKRFAPTPWSVRLPMALIGALTLLVFYRWMEHLAGRSAAVVASLLLATDPSFILTDTFDWGPVAIEHLLLVAGCLLIASRRSAFGFFCFGLALWNKAVFVWALTGLAAGTLAVYGSEVRAFLRKPRWILKGAAAFTLGALPLIVFNLHAPNATARSNIHPSFEGFSAKVVSLRATLDGSDLFGIIASPDSEGSAREPPSFYGRWSWRMGRVVGRHEQSLMVVAMIIAALSTLPGPPLDRRRAASFAIVCMAVSFFTMAGIRYTGAAHHIVLLYPLPHILVASAVSRIRSRALMRAVALVLAASSLLVVNQYVIQFERFGAYGLFTDALGSLSATLRDEPDKTIYSVDYGVGDSLNIYLRGQLHMAREWVIPQMNPRDIKAIIKDQNGLFVNRVPEREYYKGTTARLDATARDIGYRKRVVKTIYDSNGRSQFDLFQFEK